MSITALVLLAVAVLLIGVVVSLITRSEHRRVEVETHRRRASQLRAILEYERTHREREPIIEECTERLQKLLGEDQS